MYGEVPEKAGFPPYLLLPILVSSFSISSRANSYSFLGGRCKMSDYRFFISLVWEGESWGIFFYVTATANYACFEQERGKKENTKELHWIAIWRWWYVIHTRLGIFFAMPLWDFPLAHLCRKKKTFSSTIYPLLRFAGNVATVSLSSLESRICHGRSNFPHFPQSSLPLFPPPSFFFSLA